ncbi:hypothetical protein VPHK404_0063 [Vibrio phage K404]|nr:hypothetical protein SIPHO059v1_p0054 [Vibrio phage 264E42.1]
MSELPKRYVIKDAIANGPDFTVDGGMSHRFNECYFNIQFYSDSDYKTEVKPASGTVKLQLSPDGTNFYDLDTGGTIDVSTMYDPSYTLPSAAQPALDAKVSLTSIASTATHFKATLVRY